MWCSTAGTQSAAIRYGQLGGMRALGLHSPGRRGVPEAHPGQAHRGHWSQNNGQGRPGDVPGSTHRASACRDTLRRVSQIEISQILFEKIVLVWQSANINFFFFHCIEQSVHKKIYILRHIIRKKIVIKICSYHGYLKKVFMLSSVFKFLKRTSLLRSSILLHIWCPYKISKKFYLKRCIIFFKDFFLQFS